MSTASRAPRWVGWWFRGAALYGAAVLLVLFAGSAPPAGALFYYGFAGTALAFQAAFWVIGRDPVRFRPLMPAAMLEKLAFVGPTVALAVAGRIDRAGLAAAAIDLVLGLGFLAARQATPAA